jgi:purine-nucleoside phosphorylase
VAGDPALVFIRSGILRIGLRGDSYHDLCAGDVLIAQDMLPANTFFNNNIHGHTAQVIGDQQLIAPHLKLSSI